MEHFIHTQLKERERIQELFQNYFSHHNCHGFELTPISGYTKYDFEFYSGVTEYKHVLGEAKIRTFEAGKYTDTIIEKPKFFTLFGYWLFSGCTPLYLVDFEDATVIFDLTKTFEQEKDTLLVYPTFQFTPKALPATSADPSKKRIKLIRYLPLKDASIIIDKKTDTRIPINEFYENIFFKN